MQVGQPIAIEPLLHPCDTLVVDIDEADQVRDLVAGGIDALVLAQEADAGNAEAVNLDLLLRRDFALEPDKTLSPRKPLAHFAGVQIRQSRGQKLDRFVLVDDAARLAEQARRLDVGGKDLAVTVDDVGPRGRDRVLAGGAARAVAVAPYREHHQPPADHGIDRDEGHDCKSDARPRLGGAIDIAAVQKAADQPLPPWFLSPRHCRSPGAGREPVTVVRSAEAPIIAPIGSASPGLTKLGDRSGRFFRESYCVALSGLNGK